MKQCLEGPSTVLKTIKDQSNILPETKGKPGPNTAEIQDDIAEPETGSLILERLMREQEQLEFHAATVGVKVDKHSKNVHYLVTDHQMNTCV